MFEDLMIGRDRLGRMAYNVWRASSVHLMRVCVVMRKDEEPVCGWERTRGHK